MAKRITISYSYVEFEPGDKVTATLAAQDAEDMSEEIRGGAVAIVRKFSKGITEPDLIKFEGFNNWFFASDFVCHPDTVVKEK